MPRDYQISQYDKPTNGNGYLDVELEDGTIFRVPIERAHIEDDAGKNTHVGRCRRPHRRRRPFAGRLQPCRRAADRDRHQADRGCGRPRSGDRRRLHARYPRHRACAEHQPRPHGAGQYARRRERLAAPLRRRPVRHPFGDQERELVPWHREDYPVRDPPPGRPSFPKAARFCRRPVTGTRPRRPPPAAA